MTHEEKKIQLEDASEGFEVERGKENCFTGKWKALASIMGSMKDNVTLRVEQA